MDIFQIQLNAYTQLVHDCGLLDPDNHTCNAVVFDQMFVAINAGAARDETYNHMRALCRHELLNIFVRTAIQRYVLQGTMKDVSDALDLLMKSIVSVEAPAMAQHVPDGEMATPSAHAHLGSSRIVQRRSQRVRSLPQRRLLSLPRCRCHADFRWAACYIEETDTVLRRHEASLRYIFEGFARGDGELGNKMRSTSLLGYDEWARFIAMTNLVDPAFPSGVSTMCFVWARSRVVDEASETHRPKLIQLSFIDFLEALVRVAMAKALPTEDELAQWGHADAGEFLLQLQESPSAYDEYVCDHAVTFGSPPSQPPSNRVEHLISLLVRTIKGNAEGGDLSLKAAQVTSFINSGGSNRSKAPALEA